MKKYSSLYVLKAFAALCVLMVHFEFYNRQYFGPLFNCGVPLFYIISGFFMYNDSSEKEAKRYKKSIVKILKITLFFNLVYFLLRYIQTGDTIIHSIEALVNLIIYGDVIMGHLWFLNSYLWTLILFSLLLRLRDGKKILGILALFWFLLSLSERQYSFIFGLKKCFTQDYYVPSLGVSLPMMFVGYVIRKYENVIQEKLNGGRSNYLYVFITGIAIILLYAEHRMLSIVGHYAGGMMISTYIATILFFIVFINHRDFGENTFLEKIGKFHSGNIYYWQFFPYILFVSYFVKAFHLEHICLLIMIAVLLVWSSGMNYLDRLLHARLNFK